MTKSLDGSFKFGEWLMVNGSIHSPHFQVHGTVKDSQALPFHRDGPPGQYCCMVESPSSIVEDFLFEATKRAWVAR
jgi:hypothetical protein